MKLLAFMTPVTTEHFIAFLLMVITSLAVVLFFMIKSYLSHRKSQDERVENALVVNSKDHTDILRRLERGAMKLEEIPEIKKSVAEHEKKLNEHDNVLKYHDKILKSGDKYKIIK